MSDREHPMGVSSGILHFLLATLLGGHGAWLSLLGRESGSPWGLVLGAVAGLAVHAFWPG